MPEITDHMLKTNVWSPESRSLVVSMAHPTYQDEPDANIRSFDDAYERDAFALELGALDRANQMHLVKPAQYMYYGITRTVIKGQRVLAKTSQPFTIRIDAIERELRELARADETEVGGINDKIRELQEQIAMLSAHTKADAGDSDAQAEVQASSAQVASMEETNALANAKAAARNEAKKPSAPSATKRRTAAQRSAATKKGNETRQASRDAESKRIADLKRPEDSPWAE